MGKWSRRAFIGTGVVLGGGLAVGIGLGVAVAPGQRQRGIAGLATHTDEKLLQVWVKVAPDGIVTAILPHAEMGQGISTALPMMLADEMDADWDKVRWEAAPAHEEFANYALAEGFILDPMLGGKTLPGVLVDPVRGAFFQVAKRMDLQVTGGSSSVRATGMYGMRVAGAAARAMLLQAAADEMKVPAGQLRVANGVVHHDASGRSLHFGELAAAAAKLDAPLNPPLKTREQFRIMGTSKRRLDVPEKVDGTAQFGLDAKPPGLKYAAVRGAPVFGGTVKHVDESALQGMPGIVKVVNLGNAVAVVADGYWRAHKALLALKIEFDGGAAAATSSAGIFAQYGKTLDELERGGKGKNDVVLGDVDAALNGAAKVVDAEYRVPFLAHAPMEPLNATAWLHDGKLDLWTGNQNPLGFRAAAAAAAGIAADKVTVHPAYLGGGFGRKFITDYAEQAVLIAKQIDAPVKLIWSREEDIRQDRYRPAVTSRFKAGLDASGKPVAWRNGYVEKHEPADAPLIPYAIANQSIRSVASPTHVPFGPWRSVDHSQHGFFTESFVDELAHAAGKDPYQFRRELLVGEPRLLKVLDTVAEKAGWSNPLPKGWGRGIALQRSFGSIVAQVVEVQVAADGKVRAHRVVCVVDCGFAINPNGLIAQMESGAIYGLTAALYGEITIDKGAVVQSNFHDYQMVRMDDAPLLETYIVNSDQALGGAGEPGTPAIAPALANAIFAATGTRIRELPVKNYDLKIKLRETASIATTGQDAT